MDLWTSTIVLAIIVQFIDEVVHLASREIVWIQSEYSEL